MRPLFTVCCTISLMEWQLCLQKPCNYHFYVLTKSSFLEVWYRNSCATIKNCHDHLVVNMSAEESTFVLNFFSGKHYHILYCSHILLIMALGPLYLHFLSLFGIFYKEITSVVKFLYHPSYYLFLFLLFFHGIWNYAMLIWYFHVNFFSSCKYF